MPSQEAKVTVERAAEILSSAYDGQFDGLGADLQGSVQRAADNDGRIDTQHLPLILTRLPVTSLYTTPTHRSCHSCQPTITRSSVNEFFLKLLPLSASLKTLLDLNARDVVEASGCRD